MPALDAPGCDYQSGAVATTTIRMTDFGFEPPSILGILKAENEVKLEFHFVARRA